jgi:predicted nucleic acid-binding protein
MSELNQPASVFLDANIFIDILQERPGWQNSMAIVTAARHSKIKGSLSTLTVAIIHYIQKRQVSERQARDDIRKMIQGLEILGVTAEHVRSALTNGDKLFSDFEDALQFYSAKETSTTIVTRNKKHYSKISSQTEIMTPEEFLNKYSFTVRS